MAKFEVLQGFKGSPDGMRVEQFTKGETVDLCDSLAEVALAEKWVKPAKEEKTKSAKEEGAE